MTLLTGDKQGTPPAVHSPTRTEGGGIPPGARPHGPRWPLVLVSTGWGIPDRERSALDLTPATPAEGVPISRVFMPPDRGGPSVSCGRNQKSLIPGFCPHEAATVPRSQAGKKRHPPPLAP